MKLKFDFPFQAGIFIFAARSPQGKWGNAGVSATAELDHNHVCRGIRHGGIGS
jgi:hypothetical protein